jgi:hypothetical protein
MEWNNTIKIKGWQQRWFLRVGENKPFISMCFLLIWSATIYCRFRRQELIPGEIKAAMNRRIP